MSRGLDYEVGYLDFVSGLAVGPLHYCRQLSSLIFPQNEVEGKTS